MEGKGGAKKEKPERANSKTFAKDIYLIGEYKPSTNDANSL